MRSVLLSAALLVAGCRLDLDSVPQDLDCKVSTTSAVCLDAPNHSDFAFINNKIFPIACSSSTSCHMDATSSGKLDLSTAKAYESLLGTTGMGVTSMVDKTRTLVVPGMPNKSYMFFLIHGLKAEDGNPPFMTPPANVGLMPQKGTPICCQKIDAIKRWIEAGAMND